MIKKILRIIPVCVILMCSLQSASAQFNDNDYTGMFDISVSKTKNDFLVDIGYSYIYPMGLYGNIAARFEMTAYYGGALQAANSGLALWYGYDFGNKNFHVLPYAGASLNFLPPGGVRLESGLGFTTNALLGAKAFFKRFGIYGEYKHNLSKNFLENYYNRLSFGVSFAFGTPHIPAPPQPEPAPQKPPKIKSVENPTLAIEEYNKVELLYQATIDDLENASYLLTITPSNRSSFISMGNNHNVAKVNSAKQYKLPIYHSREVTAEQIVTIAKKEPDLFLRTRIIHDYVADIFYYDNDYFWNMEHLGTGNRKYSLATIIQIQRGVCLEYAILFTNLADAAGLDVYLIKDVSKPGMGHAYNTVNIDGNMYVIDTTWDSGNVYNQGKVVKNGKMNRKDYFMPSIAESYRLRRLQGW